MKYLVFDTTNILHRTFFVHKGEDVDTLSGMASHTALMTSKKYFNQVKPDKVVMCFDRPNWRKEYTMSDGAKTTKVYKANRRQKMTPKEQHAYEVFQDHMKDFERMVTDYTSIISLAEKLLEADDLIAGFCHTHPDDEIYIVSADKDMMQLITDKVHLIDPATGKERELDDVDWFMFEKCIRGDAGDNVGSAFPRVRKVRMEKAFNDDYEMANLMAETWTNEKGISHSVSEMFAENKLLMDLNCQPNGIKVSMYNCIIDTEANPVSFNYFKFMKFLGKNKLKNIIDAIEQFVPMLSK